MESADCFRCFDEDGNEFSPGLYPTPDLCVSCLSHERHDAEEEVLCNLTRADQQADEVFVCFAYRPISPEVDREEVLRDRCRRAGTEYPQAPSDSDGCDSIPF